MTEPQDEPFAPVNIDRLRRNVAVQVQETSLRSVARQVGMSPSGLEKFLRGSRPYSGSKRKLVEWWSREGGTPGAHVSAELAGEALSALLRDLPPEHRAAALGELLEILREAHEVDGVPLPDWLEEMSGGR
jgi:hypothetical protein